MDILQAIKDPKLFRPFLEDARGSISTWRPWLAALRCLYGLPVSRKKYDLIKQCTGRDPALMPTQGFNTALLLTGRRSGKSRVAAIIGAYEAALAGHEQKLAKGEIGIVAVVSPSKKQSRIVKTYMRAIFASTPMLAKEVVQEERDGFQLKNGIRIELMAGDFRTVRGYTLLAAICDEVAFFGIDEESRIKSDSELIRALQPALATAGGKLIGITSPYWKKGWVFRTWKNHFGNDGGRVLVWKCPSRTMNETLDQDVVDDAYKEDPQAAASEYGGEFRDDVGIFLDRTVIERLVVEGRTQLYPREMHSFQGFRGSDQPIRYVSFCDLSGGRSDDAALSIAHREERKVIIDYAKRWRPPFNPHAVIKLMVDDLRLYHIRKIIGDNYAADFVSRAFQGLGIGYQKCDKPKSQLYIELLPILCSGEIELLDDETLVNQLASLERRTRAGGKDIIDKPFGGHDDLANAVAGVAVIASGRRVLVGALQ